VVCTIHQLIIEQITCSWCALQCNKIDQHKNTRYKSFWIVPQRLIFVDDATHLPTYTKVQGQTWLGLRNTRRSPDGESALKMEVFNKKVERWETILLWGYYVEVSATLLSQHLLFEDVGLYLTVMRNQMSVLLKDEQHILSWRFYKHQDGLYKSLAYIRKPRNEVLATRLRDTG
jgi:hypothetical protein